MEKRQPLMPKIHFPRQKANCCLTGSPARGHVQGATAIGAAFGAIESFMENLAVEVGPAGVRAVCLRTTANTDSRTIQQTIDTIHSTKFRIAWIGFPVNSSARGEQKMASR